LISRAAQRRATRAARAQLSNTLRRTAAARLAHYLITCRRLRPGLRVAAYLPAGSELDSRPAIRALLTRGCQIFLPRIQSWRTKSMRFIPTRGLFEPAGYNSVKARWLNIVLLPLVAFDRNGNRLGSGAGFYDRALAYRRLRRYWRGPLLVGLAFDVQEIDSIEATVHDIPLDAVITESGWRFFKTTGDA
jgi:5-formyltetrahydrofolate cyclo-ligase